MRQSMCIISEGRLGPTFSTLQAPFCPLSPVSPNLWFWSGSDNCHSHVARCLNHMRYQGFRSYNMVILCFWFFFRAKYTGIAGVVRTWLPFTFLLALTLIWHFNSN